MNASNRSNHSDLIGLQIDELFKNIRPHYETRFHHAEEVIRRLRDIIDEIPCRKGLLASDAQRALDKSSGIRIPFPNHGAESASKLLLGFSRPASIHVVGSFARKTALIVDGQVTIDMAVEMPSGLFQPKDCRNFRYFRKRAYYLACLADGIQIAKPMHLAISFAAQDDNPLQPILIINVTNDRRGNYSNSSKYRIRILPAASIDLFPVDQILPTKSCVSKVTAGRKEILPTPTYNATIRSECCSLTLCEHLQRLSVQSHAFRGGCMLGAIWLRQRGFTSSIRRGGFGQFEWASLMSALMRGGGRGNRPVLLNDYSSYQLFKATLQFLATTDLVASPMFLESTNLKFHRTNYPIFFDGSKGLDYLFKMTKWSYKMLRHQARISLETFRDPLVDQFKALFISRVDELTKNFDYFFRIPLEEHDVGIEAVVNVHVDLANQIYEKLAYGLGDRATLIFLYGTCGSSWQVDSPPSSFDNCLPSMVVGLHLNPEITQRMVDRGPSVDDKEASALFREFWGDKAELRRFKDGSILESVVWDLAGSRQALLDVIALYILDRHFHMHILGDINFSGQVLDVLLPRQAATEMDILAPFSPIRNVFDGISKLIREIEGLPLQIRQISAVSPELRFTSLFAPTAGEPLSHRWPVEFQVEFEGSARWPQNLTAAQRTKSAFLLKIAEGLETHGSVQAAAVGLENGKNTLPPGPFLDIVTEEGFMFRLRIYHEPELKVLERLLHGGMSSSLSREQLALAVSDHKRQYIQGPAHTQAVYALSTRFPLMSPTIRLLKKWRDSHFLSSHLCGELIELLATRTFVHPYPWQPPGSLNSAFVRTLAFIANWDWQSEPLLVDFSAELTKQDIEAINARFQAWRKLDPGMNRVAIFAASNIDREGITWTDRRPAKVIASRFSRLAIAASEIIREKWFELTLETLFTPSLQDFDFVVHLKHPGGMSVAKSSSFKNLQLRKASDPLDSIFNPHQAFFNELEDLYGENCILFYNRSATTTIAGLWNPHIGPRDWKVNVPYNAMLMPDGGEPQTAINKAAVLHEIARLGHEIITKIDQKT